MFVAEIGLNHKGSEKRAFRMLKGLVATNIDAVTFQIPKPIFYQTTKKWGGPLSPEFYKKVIDFVHQNRKLIGFAIQDKEVAPFLFRAGVDFWKTLSGSMADDDLLVTLQKTRKPLFISTGMSSEKEVVNISKKFKKATFIHTQLSHKIEDSNVKAIERLRKVTNKKIAFGLHCKNHQVLYLSVALEPSDIFFYIKDNVREKFPDDEHAILIHTVSEIITDMKELKKALGNGIKNKAINAIT